MGIERVEGAGGGWLVDEVEDGEEDEEGEGQEGADEAGDHRVRGGFRLMVCQIRYGGFLVVSAGTICCSEGCRHL